MVTNSTKCILQLVTDSTQTLDFSFPILSEIRNRFGGKVRLIVIFCGFDKKSFCSGSDYYLRSLMDLGVEIYDLSDFVKGSARIPVLFFKIFLGPTLVAAMTPNIRMLIKKPSDLVFCGYGLKIKIEKFMLKNFFDPKCLFQQFHLDLVFFDKRAKFKRYGGHLLENALVCRSIKTVVLPHAPHGGNKHDDFIPVEGAEGSTCIHYWTSLVEAKPPKGKNSKKLDFCFTHIGFPYLDWRPRNHLGAQKTDEDHKLFSFLYIPEKFNHENHPIPEVGSDLSSFSQTYQKLQDILFLLDRFFVSYNLIIKPHPKTQYGALEELIFEIKDRRVTYSRDPLLDLVNKSDAVISEFSTAALFACASAPLLLVDTTLSQHWRSRWPLLDNLYRGISLNFSEEGLLDLKEIIQDHGSIKDTITENISTLKRHFGCHAVNKAILDIQKLW